MATSQDKAHASSFAATDVADGGSAAWSRSEQAYERDAKRLLSGVVAGTKCNYYTKDIDSDHKNTVNWPTGVKGMMSEEGVRGYLGANYDK